MKLKVFLMAIMVFCFSMKIDAQYQDKKGDGSKALERIEQMEHARLIEILDMKEETAIKFFARRKDYKTKMGELYEKRFELVKSIEEFLKDGNVTDDAKVKEKLNSYIATDNNIVNERKAFYKSLNGLLSAKQILKMVLFDEKTRREIRETIMHKMKPSEH